MRINNKTMHLYQLLLLITAVTAIPMVNEIQPRAAVESDQSDFRLPGFITPYTYDISITLPENVFSEASTAFSGTVTILLSTNQSITEIHIHSKVTILEATILEATSTDPLSSMHLTVSRPNATTSIAILTLPTDQELAANINYILTISYNGDVEPVYMRGLYRSSYEDEGTTKYLLTTQFQPDYARNAFPCFDEPQYKAEFTMVITHPSTFNALFNTDSASNTTDPNNMTVTTFNPSPFMSTYLVAFVVSEFTCTGEALIAENVPHQVCSRNNSEAQRALANKYGPVIMQALENKTGIPYNSTQEKMDQLAIPDFSAGAMENWGLVTYREPYLLYSDTESSNINKQDVITIIAHEFAHMWFGNLVTTKWWNTLFLNEGFASYFEYFAPALIEELEVGEVWELAKQFVVDQVHNALASDGNSQSRALSAQASSSAEIWAKFDVISYHKGASVIRMVEHFLGSENFESGIKSYLSNYTEGNTEPSDLWSSLQTSVQAGSLPDGVNLETVMNNWIDQPGYPVIMVNASGNDILITQKRFLYSGSDSTTWYVPLSYTTAANTSEFENTAPKEWLYPGNLILRIPGVLANNAWVIVNNRESSFYRVNYDTTLWSRIRETLLSNHNAIDVLNRAQIVDDVFNLARAGQLRYSEAINILNYLTVETEYYPLVAAASNFEVLYRLVGANSNLGRELSSLELQFLNAVKDSVSFDNSNGLNQIDTLKTRLILGRLCKLGEPTCISRALDLFRNFTTDVSSSIDRNLRSLVYCNGLRYSDNSTGDWDFLWTRFQDSTLATEKVTILSSLGCTKDTTLLHNYLNYSIDPNSGIRPQDIVTVWSSVITSNPEGVEVAFNFYSTNADRIKTYFSSSISLISSIATRFNTEEQINRLEALNNTLSDESIKEAITAAIGVARNNQEWLTENSPELEEYFRKPDGGGAVRNIGITLALIMSSLVILFN